MKPRLSMRVLGAAAVGLLASVTAVAAPTRLAAVSATVSSSSSPSDLLVRIEQDRAILDQAVAAGGLTQAQQLHIDHERVILAKAENRLRATLTSTTSATTTSSVATTQPPPTTALRPTTTAAPVTTTQAPIASLWRAGAEAGNLDEWGGATHNGGGVFNNGAATARASRDVARSGSWSAKLTIDTSSRTDTGARLFRWKESRENTEGYYSTWLYFPQRVTTTGGWWNVFQFKSRTSTRNDPVWILNVGNRSNGNMYLYPYYWLSSGPRAGQQGKMSFPQTAVDLPVGRWVHLEVFLRQSGSNTGQIIVWQDGVEIFNMNNVQTRYPTGNNEWSINNYASHLSPAVATLYVDDAVISRTRVGPR